MCESAALNIPANLENSAVATILESFSFHSSPKEENAKEYSNYPTVALNCTLCSPLVLFPGLWKLSI